MNDLLTRPRRIVGALCVFSMLLVPGGGLIVAQDALPPQDSAPPASAPVLSPEQLDTLVAPVALYPDALLSQVLVASTYPLEITEVSQWLAQNRNLQGQQLVQAAQQQNWDPSIQALVVFPDVLTRMASDIRWTTDLGNAFLAQQADVMSAVQRLRSQAMASGRLRSNSQEIVSTQEQGGQTVVDIQPANPAVVYVPVYNPEYIWGPPAWGYYPPLYYPAIGFGFGFGPGIYIGGFFGGLGWGGWGWSPNWFGGAIFTNAFFFNHYGFHNYYGGYRGFGGRGWDGGFRGGVWAHNPVHRMGVPYGNQTVANRFGGNFASRGTVANRGTVGSNFANRGTAPGTFGNRGNFNASRPNTASRSLAAPNRQANGGWSHFGNSSAPAARSSAPRPAPSSQFATRGTSPSNGSAYRPSTPPRQANGGWSHFGNSSAPATRSSAPRPALSSQFATRGSSPTYGGAYRPSPAPRQSPSYAARSMPAYHSPAFSGANRGTPSGGGWNSARSAPSVHSSPSFGGFHGGASSHASSGFHASGGGGSHPSGGGSHSSGGHGGGRR